MYKSFADFKRALRVGQIVNVINHARPGASGPRTITKIQQSGVWLASSDVGMRAWVPWPAARLVKVEADGVSLSMDDGRGTPWLEIHTATSAPSGLRALLDDPTGPYYTVVVPWVPDTFRTDWHPRESTGPFATLTRGAFTTREEAIEWGRAKLSGTPYEVRLIPAVAENADGK